MAKNNSLSLRVQWLGERLRAARERAGYTLDEAGEYLQLRHNTLSRFETGTVRAKPSYVRDLIDFYGISDERERAVLLQLNQDAWRKDLWDTSDSGFNRDFIDYTWLESRASKLSFYHPLLIPGVLLAPAYAEALIRTGQGSQAHENTITITLEARLERQRILHTEPPTEISAIVEETTLRRAIGSREDHVAQLQHLLTLAKKDHIEIHVLEPESGWHPGLDGVFTLIDLPDPYPGVVYIENMVGRTFLEDEIKVGRYRSAYDCMLRQSLSQRHTANLIADLIKEFE